MELGWNLENVDDNSGDFNFKNTSHGEHIKRVYQDVVRRGAAYEFQFYLRKIRLPKEDIDQNKFLTALEICTVFFCDHFNIGFKRRSSLEPNKSTVSYKRNSIGNPDESQSSSVNKLLISL